MTDSLDPLNPFSHESGGWQNLLDEGSYDNKDGWTWTFYEEYEGHTPHQGWKIHISSEPEEGRQVAETVLPYLQNNSIQHKITDNPYRLDSYRGGNEHRLITIFPPYDLRLKEEITKGNDEVRLQYFTPDSREHNIKSINANTNTAAKIIEDLLDQLEDEGLLFGPTIEGEDREEYQVGDSRAHYRYTINSSDALIELNGHEPVIGDELIQDGDFDVVKDKRLIGPDAEVISNHRHPEPPETAQHPVDLNWVQKIRYNKE